MAASNMANPAVDPSREDELFAQEVAEVKKWWSGERWRYTKRPFTAEQIVSKRGHLKIEYASNAQAKKLWRILEGRFQSKDASYTYGCLEPTMVTQMAKYLDTVYVSGWQSSSTASASDEPGPDLADYPYVRTTIHLPCLLSSCSPMRTDHRSEQGIASVHGTALPRPKAASRASVDTEGPARQARQRRLPPTHHRRCRYWSRRFDGRYEVDQALHREGCRWNSH